MFLRQAKTGDHTYLRLVENYRHSGKVRQRVVLQLGRKDLLAPHGCSASLAARRSAFAGPASINSRPRRLGLGARSSRHFWDELALESILDGKRPRRRHGQPLLERTFVFIANRLSHPGSEHALAAWLEQACVCNGAGSHSGSRGGA
jgi:hypothetical protein